MRKKIDKDFNPAEVWLKAMDRVEKAAKMVVDDSPVIDMEIEGEIKARERRERALKNKERLLANNPNYFKELSAKAHAKLKAMREENDVK